MTKYKSDFERRLHTDTFSTWEYEPETISYLQPEVKRSYTPDFVKVIDGIKVYIEAKGRFRTMAEAYKYLHIRAGLSSDKKIVFVISSLKTKMPGKVGKRKDGSSCKRQTMAEWLKKKGFEYIVEGETYNE